jgi:hypothetical protein
MKRKLGRFQDPQALSPIQSEDPIVAPFFSVDGPTRNLLEDQGNLVGYAGLPSQTQPEGISRGKLNKDGELYNRFTNEVSRGPI